MSSVSSPHYQPLNGRQGPDSVEESGSGEETHDISDYPFRGKWGDLKPGVCGNYV